MLEIDGSGGGGQLVRTALSVSALTGRAFRLTDVRGARSTPGLRPQHLAAVRTMASVTDATVSDASVGTSTLEFDPGAVRPGDYDVDVGTAGSVPLLFDALLPLSTALSGSLRLRATGGTDVRWAPTTDYLREVKLPLLRRVGVLAAVDVDRRGFYPVGGGRATLTLAPSTPRRLELDPVQRSAAAVEARVYSVATTDLAEGDVAERQAGRAEDALAKRDVAVVDRRIEYARADCPGTAIALRLDRGGTVMGFDALGERGKPAETVADEAVEAAIDALTNPAAVDPHLADQLLPFLAIAGGRVSIPAVTDHVETSLPLLGQFGYDVRVERVDGRPVLAA